MADSRTLMAYVQRLERLRDFNLGINLKANTKYLVIFRICSLSNEM